MAEAVAAIKEQQSKADVHGGAAKQRGESCFSPNPNPNLNPNLQEGAEGREARARSHKHDGSGGVGRQAQLGAWSGLG